MRITKWGEYGALCSIYLARCTLAGNSVVGAAEIASAQNIALDYAQQILQRLRKANVIESVRGSKGGYRLSRPLEEISLLEVIVAAEGDSLEIICETKPLQHPNCMQGAWCCLKPIWFELKEQINKVLDQYSLFDLATYAHTETDTSDSVVLGHSLACCLGQQAEVCEKELCGSEES